ncbi:epsilon-sarcoglycan [Aphis craccivora]|uniref:Epsilon-sarcoglycan n=1 Tax=Aphis craccivora TaxID=307492 RepID=A0A6G0Z6E2_APHCR|nr:epsilon-sarcoglycan [Aphis craccivora]
MSTSVVVNLGSSSNFSTILYDLEKEISPLQKMNKCPKDFKRTSVERYFRANGFNLDWCSFKLVELTFFNHNHTMNVQEKKSKKNYAEENVWELVESLQYSQSMYTDTTKFNITLLIFIIIVVGLILSIGIFRWYKKKVIFF